MSRYIRICPAHPVPPVELAGLDHLRCRHGHEAERWLVYDREKRRIVGESDEGEGPSARTMYRQLHPEARELENAPRRLPKIDATEQVARLALAKAQRAADRARRRADREARRQYLSDSGLLGCHEIERRRRESAA